jgi:hypothetical protein
MRLLVTRNHVQREKLQRNGQFMEEEKGELQK